MKVRFSQYGICDKGHGSKHRCMFAVLIWLSLTLLTELYFHLNFCECVGVCLFVCGCACLFMFPNA